MRQGQSQERPLLTDPDNPCVELRRRSCGEHRYVSRGDDINVGHRSADEGVADRAANDPRVTLGSPARAHLASAFSPSSAVSGITRYQGAPPSVGWERYSDLAPPGAVTVVDVQRLRPLNGSAKMSVWLVADGR